MDVDSCTISPPHETHFEDKLGILKELDAALESGDLEGLSYCRRFVSEHFVYDLRHVGLAIQSENLLMLQHVSSAIINQGKLIKWESVLCDAVKTNNYKIFRYVMERIHYIPDIDISEHQEEGESYHRQGILDEALILAAETRFKEAFELLKLRGAKTFVEALRHACSTPKPAITTEFMTLLLSSAAGDLHDRQSTALTECLIRGVKNKMSISNCKLLALAGAVITESAIDAICKDGTILHLVFLDEACNVNWSRISCYAATYHRFDFLEYASRAMSRDDVLEYLKNTLEQDDFISLCEEWKNFLLEKNLEESHSPTSQPLMHRQSMIGLTPEDSKEPLSNPSQTQLPTSKSRGTSTPKKRKVSQGPQDTKRRKSNTPLDPKPPSPADKFRKSLSASLEDQKPEEISDNDEEWIAQPSFISQKGKRQPLQIITQK